MTDTARRRVVRWAAIAAIVHGILVTMASMAYGLLLGEEISVRAGGFLRVIDGPVHWVIERAVGEAIAVFLEDGYRLSASWPLNPVWTSILVLSLVHSVIGGTFYAGLAAMLAFLIHHRRARSLAA